MERSWKKSLIQFHVVSKRVSVRQRRTIFNAIRSFKGGVLTADLFFPHFGMTLGEYCTWHILNEFSRKKRCTTATRHGKNC